MNARASDWDAIGCELAHLREAAREQVDRLGHVTPQLLAALNEATSRAEAALAIDDAKTRRAA